MAALLATVLARLLALLNLASGPLRWVLSWVISLIFKKIGAEINRWNEERKAKRDAEERLKKYKQAVEKGDQDAADQIGEDILNGHDSH